MKNALLFCCIVTLLTSACAPSLSPFTQRLQKENRWSTTELKQIQFYLSKDIVLYRQASSGDSKIEDGKIRMVDGRRIREVIIPKGTPGVLIDLPKQNRFAVSFEKADDRFLLFGPNPKRGNRYVLLAKEWKRNRGKVLYGGETYYTNGENSLATLMVDLKKSRKVSVKSRTAKGRTLD